MVIFLTEARLVILILFWKKKLLWKRIQERQCSLIFVIWWASTWWMHLGFWSCLLISSFDKPSQTLDACISPSLIEVLGLTKSNRKKKFLSSLKYMFLFMQVFILFSVIVSLLLEVVALGLLKGTPHYWSKALHKIFCSVFSFHVCISFFYFPLHDLVSASNGV